MVDPVTDYVQAMSKACQAGFSAVGDLRLYKRLVMSGFVLAGFMITVSMMNVKHSTLFHSGEELSANSSSSRHELSMPKHIQTISVNNSQELITQLRGYRLWDEPLPSSVAPIVLRGYPGDLVQLPVEEKKKAFLHTLLPMALIALSEVSMERRELLQILSSYDQRPENFASDEDDEDDRPAWMEPLTVRERNFVIALTQKYRTDSVSLLLRRINTVPVSLILAQGAIESSWGTSRFANMGNNLFGIWTWSGPGIVPAEREEGKTHKVASYKTLLDSVRAYILMLNRVEAYRQFRVIRQRTSDPVALAAGLLNYSERGGVYVSDIGRVIEFNNLREYDGLALNAVAKPSTTVQAAPEPVDTEQPSA